MSRARLAPAGGGPGREAVVLALLLLLLRPVLLPEPRPAVGAMNDDGIYVALGRAIAEGRGYRSTYLPRDPVQVRYPPGLPTILAALWRAGQTLDRVADLALALNALLISLAAALLYWVGRTRLRLHPGLAAVLVVGPFLLDPSLVYSELILSEPYFVAGWAGAVILAYRVAEVEPGGRRTAVALALGLTLAATALVRTQAVALVPALICALLWKRVGAPAIAAAAIGALAALVAWHWVHAGWVAAGPLSTAADEVSYVAWTGIDSPGSALATLGAATLLNGMRYPVIFSFYFSDLVLGGFLIVISLAVLATGGAARRLRSDPALVLGTAAVAAVTVSWPGTQDRLVLPVLPFIGLLAGSEIQRLLKEAGPRGRTVLLTCLVMAISSVGLRQFTMRRHVNARLAAGAAADFYTPSDYVRRTSRTVLEISEWVNANTRADDRVMVAVPAGVYLHTGRKVLPAAPARPIVGNRAVQVPGEYLASQILAEHPTILIVHGDRNGDPPIARDVAVVRAACPDVLVPLRPTSSAPFRAAYRIRADAECLEVLARGAAAGRGLPAGSAAGDAAR